MYGQFCHARVAEALGVVAVVATLSKGYDLEYIWKQVDRGPAKDAAGYYIQASESGGEPPGRWWGPGAKALGFDYGQIVEREPYEMLFGERKAPDGTKLGKSPGDGRKAADLYAQLLAAEPHATTERKSELRTGAVKNARQSPLFFDLTISLSKSISIFHASLGENARLARQAGDHDSDAYWSSLVGEVDDMIWQGDDLGVVDEPVDHRGGNDFVAEGLAPPAERLVGRYDQAGPLVAGGDELEEQVGGFGFEGDVADFVDDQQRVAAEPGELVLQAAGLVGFGQAGDPLGGGGELHPVAGLAAVGGQAGGQVGLAGAGKDGDRLQQLRAVLPCQVRVTSATHPLSGRLVAARSFTRLHGVLVLVIELPDGSPGTIAAAATDVLGRRRPLARRWCWMPPGGGGCGILVAVLAGRDEAAR